MHCNLLKIQDGVAIVEKLNNFEGDLGCGRTLGTEPE